MFEFFFKYPSTVFSKGSFVLLGSWPVWTLWASIAAAAAVLAWLLWRRRTEVAPGIRGLRGGAVWLLQTLLVSLLLLLLWHPAISVATLKPQQNIVAVIVDDSASMGLVENGSSRLSQAVRTLNGGLLKSLQDRFQTRLYRMGDVLERIDRLDQLHASAHATHIGENLRHVVEEAGSLPIGAVVLLSDGADNAGGIGLQTISEIRRQHIPVHTIGFGRERFDHDLEISDVQLPARTLANARLAAQVTFRERGYSGQKARIVVRDSGKVLASQEVTVKQDGVQQTESVPFSAGSAGAKAFDISIDPLAGEENVNNNRVTRLVNVESGKRRILYFEGEPRWEYKFLRRAVEDDQSLEVVSVLRTTENKLYVQDPEGTAKYLQEGFPARVDDLFGFQGLIVGSVEAAYFTPIQQELIRQFVDRRGGGMLFLGGRFALADGGWGKSPLADLLPLNLPDHKNTFHRDPADVELTAAGRDSLITRLEDNPDANVARWKKLPYLMNYQEPGTPKPGAVVLAEMMPRTAGGRLPLLTIENYGRGRTAVFATEGSWRWQMLQPLSDMTHEMFYRQLLRWLVTGTPTHVTATTPQPLLADESHVRLRAEVRDNTYLPSADAQVEAHILGPGNVSATVEMRPNSLEPGVYTGDWTAEAPGSYLAEVVARRGSDELGRDVVTFRREDGVAENFRAEQNRDLLEKLSSETGGRYYRPAGAGRLSNEISYSEAGISVRENKDIWDMPALFLLAILLRAGEWLLRRKWGVL